MQGKILIIEDEPDLADLLQLYLEKEGLSARKCLSAEEGQRALKEEEFDLISLDINLPGMDGFEFLSLYRKEGDLPVLIMSARESDEDIIMGLGIGADNFIPKPVSPRVYTARIRAMLRRKRQPDTDTRIVFGDFTLDPPNYLLKKGTERIALSSREFDLLIFLAQNPKTLFSSEDLYQQVWKNAYGDSTAVGVYIQRLRKKLFEGMEGWIETVRGRGYRFTVPEGRSDGH